MHAGFYGDSPEVDGLDSYNNTAHGLKYRVSAQYGPCNRGQPEDRYEDYYDADGALFEKRTVERPELKNEIVLNASGGGTSAMVMS